MVLSMMLARKKVVGGRAMVFLRSCRHRIPSVAGAGGMRPILAGLEIPGLNPGARVRLPLFGRRMEAVAGSLSPKLSH